MIAQRLLVPITFPYCSLLCPQENTEIIVDTTERVREKRKKRCARNTIVLLENKSPSDPLKRDAFHFFDQRVALLFAISLSVDLHSLSIDSKTKNT